MIFLHGISVPWIFHDFFVNWWKKIRLSRASVLSKEAKRYYSRL